MTNAIKFTRKGKILVEGIIGPRHDEPEELQVRVSVSDEGIGMKEDEVKRVFDGFLDKRSPLSKSLNPYGNGIGLSFCK